MEKAKLMRNLHIVAGVLIIALAVGLYKAKTDAARTETHVRQLQSQIDEREADLRALRAEIAHLESPARVEALAEQHLGASVGSESAALPETAIASRLPAPERREQKARE
jgi:cell division protein FtsL